MNPTTQHLTEPHGDSTLHYWEVRGDRGAVSLSAMEMPDAYNVFAAMGKINPSTGDLFSGRYVFDVAQTHWTRPGGWGCSRHGDGCDMDAFVSSVALPAWRGAVAAGLTDEAVYAALRPLFDVEYGRVTS